MIEWLKHLTGFCGEPHPSLLTLLGGTPVLGYAIYKMKDRIKNLIGKKNDKEK